MSKLELIVIISTLVFSAAYTFIIASFTAGWFRVPRRIRPAGPKHTISIIIPFRNEAHQAGRLAVDLLSQDYPAELFEILFINDHSTDDTVECLSPHLAKGRLSVLHLPDSQKGKKKALASGIDRAMGEIILSIDADCKPGKEWLATVDAYFQQGPYKMLAGPVAIEKTGGGLPLFQAVEMISLQASGAGAIGIQKAIMCNGANLAFKKESFYEAGGYSGNEHIAGGDDIFLLEKFKHKYGGRHIGYMKERSAIVFTPPAGDIKSYLNQRFRWVAKSPAYRDPDLIITAITVLFFSLSILFNLCFAPVFASDIMLCLALFTFILKSIVDLPLLWMASGFFGRRQALLRNYIFLQPAHILFVVFSGILGNIIPFRWKNRKVH